MKAMLQRVNAVVGGEAMIGRWSEDQFLMLLDLDSVAAVAISNDLGPKLSSRYAVQEDGIAHQLTLHIAMAVVEQVPGGDARKFRVRLEQMTGVSAG